MSEHINNVDLFGSGGHQWCWQPAPVIDKRLRAVGCIGEVRMVLAAASADCTIQGRDGGPAVLGTYAASKALADLGMDGLEAAIRDLMHYGQEYSWEDDCGRAGAMLVVTDYRPAGPRLYGRTGQTHHCWQYYTAHLADLSGGYL